MTANKYSNIKQGSEEWEKIRTGRLTASRVADVLSKVKTGESASRKNLRTDIVIERLTGKKTEGFTNAAMEWGVETEPLARAAYEATSGNLVDQVAFVDHPVIEHFGCSPDGLVGNDGLIEIKCPNTNTHLEYIEADKPPNKYITQMQAQMSCTGRKWCDFVSFDPRLPDGLQLLVIRVNRDDKYISIMEDEVMKFLAEVSAAEVKLRQRMEKANG